MSKKFSVLYVVIDALDESKNPDEFVRGLRSLTAVADTVRMLITGRNNYSLDRLVGAIATHRIVLEQNIANDIKAFVTFEVDARIMARKLKIRSADLRERIVKDLSRYSDGMWVSLVNDSFMMSNSYRQVLMGRLAARSNLPTY